LQTLEYKVDSIVYTAFQPKIKKTQFDFFFGMIKFNGNKPAIHMAINNNVEL